MIIDLEKIPKHLFAWALESNLRHIVMPYKVYGHFLAAVRSHLDADSAFLYRGFSRGGSIEAHSEGKVRLHSEELIREFAARRRPEIPRNILLSPLKIHGRLAGVVGVARRGRDFQLGKGRILNKLSTLLGDDLARREEERLVQVLGRITEKVISQLHPRDLAYQILDGLYQLVHYDHSAALLVFEPEGEELRVEAEKIVWTKSKSAFIGHQIPVSRRLVESLRHSPQGRVFPANSRPESDGQDSRLYQMLNYSRGSGIPQETSLLCVPLFFGEEFLGLLKIASYERAEFDRHDVEVVERFLPAARVALRNARVKTSLENMALQAEMRAGLVTLARAVAHDVNNAIGAILPLAKQAREECQAGVLDQSELEQDLEVIIDKASLCRRIFSNMLRTAKDRSETGLVDVNQLLREMIPMLESMVATRGISLQFDLEGGLPMTQFSKQHLERVVWNLVTNAVQALSVRPGKISVGTKMQDGNMVLSVKDDGPGISSDDIDKVLEPFFTTRQDGTGLGLSICRSLVWQHGGAIDVKSSPGKGAKVEIRLLPAEVAETAASKA